MSAQGWEGRKLQIALAGVILAAVRTKSVSFTNDTIDLTDGERNGYRRLAERGDTKAAQVQVDGVATSENYQVLRDLWAGDSWGELEVWNPDGSVLPARAFLAGLDRSGEKEGFISFAATFLLDVSVFSAREAGSDGTGFVPIAPEYLTSNEYSAESTTKLLLHFEEDGPYVEEGAAPIDSALAPNTLVTQADGASSQDDVAKFGFAAKLREYSGGPGYGFRIAAANFNLDGFNRWSIEAFVHVPLGVDNTTGTMKVLGALSGAAALTIRSAGEEAITVRFLASSGQQLDSGNIPTSEQVHVAVCRNDTLYRLFVNGVLADSGELGETEFGADLQVAANNGVWPYDIGHIDELRVVAGVALFTADFTPPVAPYTP